LNPADASQQMNGAESPGRLNGRRGRVRAITARFKRVAARARSATTGLTEGQFRSLFETAPYAQMVVDPAGNIVLVNSAAANLFGYARTELIGLRADSVLIGRSRAGAPWYRQSDEAERQSEFDLLARRRDGGEFPVELTLSPVQSGGELLLSAAIRDTTERTQAAEVLAHQASHDALTGLPNRTLFLDRLDHGLARARRSHAKLAVIFLDLDDFKLVNDTRGHDTGDLLLVALIPRLVSALRPGDTIARFGGDEFVVLCEELASEDDAVNIARRIADACNRPVRVGDYEHAVTVSAGVVIVDSGAATPSTVLRDADSAMYRAKGLGKGRVEVFDEQMRARLVERIAVESELRQAIRNDELRVFYQPVMALGRGTIVGVEALLRWEHPVRGLLEPAEFMHVAESSGLIIPIGEWVIEQACRQAVAWRDAHPSERPIFVSVNLSPRQVARSDVAGSVARILRSTGLDPHLLDLEITERTLLEDQDASARALRELKTVGVRLVLDDFGTGYSSLSYLKRFTIDAVKIDRSFVDGLGNNEEDSAIVGAVLSVAHALDVGVTAEGVETDAQLTRLRDEGCAFGQGYLFGRPSRAEKVSEMLDAGAMRNTIAA
jgi:diguanylate cyclase (GGDEF)-like protein/PAS domain S-box-containing protein